MTNPTKPDAPNTCLGCGRPDTIRLGPYCANTADCEAEQAGKEIPPPLPSDLALDLSAVWARAEEATRAVWALDVTEEEWEQIRTDLPAAIRLGGALEAGGGAVP